MLDVATIRRLRESRGMTQGEAARRAGMSGRARWSDLEAGRKVDVRLSTLEAIAKALGVKPGALLKCVGGQGRAHP
ncbi:MAG: helix-turn-helix transcriptional regulator [Planctomycetia bacterium]|nr:helix-turn-helix transcriptional regulator [Planctomycetia bacterium]